MTFWFIGVQFCYVSFPRGKIKHTMSLTLTNFNFKKNTFHFTVILMKKYQNAKLSNIYNLPSLTLKTFN